MIVYPPCKINLGLHVIRKRPDHFHDLETVFVAVALHDILEVLPSTDGKLHFSQSGIKVAGDPMKNLCVKAWQLLKHDHPALPEVQIHLHKKIPAGAGLGGGSADAAYTLRALDQLFGLGLGQEALLNYAAELGSDCPFFIMDRPCYATGRGEILETTSVDLKGYRLMIVNPGIHIETARAFQSIKPAPSGKDLKAIIAQPLEQWKDQLQNDFEAPVFLDHPEIKKIKDELYAAGALYASMSGSGSSVFAVFPKQVNISLQWPEKYFIWTGPAQ